jgi:hypothetical protein
MSQAGVSMPSERVWRDEKWDPWHADGDALDFPFPRRRTTPDRRQHATPRAQPPVAPPGSAPTGAGFLFDQGAYGPYPAIDDEPEAPPPAARRTVVIRGGADPARHLPLSEARRRPVRRRHERHGFRPDRAAMWAFLLGLLLVLAAAASSHAAVLAAHLH